MTTSTTITHYTSTTGRGHWFVERTDGRITGWTSTDPVIALAREWDRRPHILRAIARRIAQSDIVEAF